MNKQTAVNKLNQQIKLIDEKLAEPDLSDGFKAFLTSVKTLAIQIRSEVRKAP